MVDVSRECCERYFGMDDELFDYTMATLPGCSRCVSVSPEIVRGMRIFGQHVKGCFAKR